MCSKKPKPIYLYILLAKQLIMKTTKLFIVALLLFVLANNSRAQTNSSKVFITAADLIYLVNNCDANSSAETYLKNKDYNFRGTKEINGDTRYIYRANKPAEVSNGYQHFVSVYYYEWQDLGSFKAHVVKVLTITPSVYIDLLNDFNTIGFDKTDGTTKDDGTFENIYENKAYPNFQLTVTKGKTEEGSIYYFFELLTNVDL